MEQLFRIEARVTIGTVTGVPEHVVVCVKF